LQRPPLHVITVLNPVKLTYTVDVVG